MSPAELMFARKIQSVFDKLIPLKKGNKKKINTANKTYSPGEKTYFLNYHFGKATWLKGLIEKRIGNMMYITKHLRWKVRRHINQIKKDIPQTQRNKLKNPCQSFMSCLRYLDPHQHNKTVRANENVPRRELCKKIPKEKNMMSHGHNKKIFCGRRCCIVACTVWLPVSWIKDIVFLNCGQYWKISVSSKTNFGYNANSTRLIFVGLYHFS